MQIEYNFFKGNEKGMATTMTEVLEAPAGDDIAAYVSTNYSQSFDTLNSTRPRACAYLNFNLNQTDYYRGRNAV